MTLALSGTAISQRSYASAKADLATAESESFLEVVGSQDQHGLLEAYVRPGHSFAMSPTPTVRSRIGCTSRLLQLLLLPTLDRLTRNTSYPAAASCLRLGPGDLWTQETPLSICVA